MFRDAVIVSLNAALGALQDYETAHVAEDGDKTSELLYEATYELCHHLKQSLLRNALADNVSRDSS